MEIKTQLTQCPNGHYYNAAIHASCPECARLSGGLGATADLSSNGAPVMGVTEPLSGVGAGGGSFGVTEPLSGVVAGGGSFGVTEPLNSVGAGGGNFGATEPLSRDPRGGGSSPFQPTMIGGDLGVDGGTEPVVGWIVCIDGPMRGNDYRLHAGYNYIGRETGDVRITGDQQISRQNHAMIAYDDTDRVFYVGPASGRNLIKVNGKTVLNAVDLHNYDILSIGTTKLIFVALCGEQFDWKQE